MPEIESRSLDLREIPKDTRREVPQNPRDEELTKALHNSASLEDLLSSLKGYGPAPEKENDKTAAAVASVTNMQQIDIEKESMREERTPEPAPVLEREIEKPIERERVPERTREVERERETPREVLDRLKEEDARAKIVIDKLADIRERVNQGKFSQNSSSGVLEVRGGEKIQQMTFVTEALSEMYKDVLEERQEAISRAYDSCNLKAAGSTFEKMIDGREAEITKEEKDNYELAFFLKSDRGLPDSRTALLEYARSREESGTKLETPEITTRLSDLSDTEIRKEAIKLDKNERDTNELKIALGNNISDGRSALIREFGKQGKLFDRIYEGRYECSDSRYEDYRAKRERIEREYEERFRSVSDNYREVLDRKDAEISRLEGKFDQRICDALNVSKACGITLKDDEKSYMQARDDVKNLREAHSDRMYQFCAVDRAKEESRNITDIIPRASEKELREIEKSVANITKEEEAHAVFDRLDRFFHKVVPFDAVKNGVFDEMRTQTLSYDKKLTEIKADELGKRDDGLPRSPIELRRDAEKIYNKLELEMEKNVWFRSSEIKRAIFTKKVFNDSGKGLSDDLKADSRYKEMNKLSVDLRNSRHNEEREEKSRFNPKALSEFLSRTKDKAVEKIQRHISPSAQRDEDKGRDQTKDEAREKNVKSSILSKLSDLRNAAKEKAEAFSAGYEDMREKGLRNWAADKLRDAADRLSQLDEERAQPQHAYVAQHYK